VRGLAQTLAAAGLMAAEDAARRARRIQRILPAPRGEKAAWLTGEAVAAVVLGRLALAAWLYSRRPRAAAATAAGPAASVDLHDDDLDW
jgi:ferric-dicitrate binding protein FerR (iron transport regulator)